MSKLLENGWIVSQKEVARMTYLLRIRSPQIARAAGPGQFLMLQVRDGVDPLIRRPFSFHRLLPDEGIIEILYRVVGRGTWLLSQCPPETRLSLLGPLGNGFRTEPRPNGPILLIAGGIGIAPLFELMVRLASAKTDATATTAEPVRLFYGARTADEMLPDESFSGMSVTIHRSTDDGSLGFRGYVTQLLQQVVQDEGIKPGFLYSCGPLAMQYHAAKWAATNGVTTQLSLESLMACGLGACLGCALPAAPGSGAIIPGAAISGDSSEDRYVHVCKDGPIFEAGSIQWNKIQMQQICPPTFLSS
jgi:dihydroorotate dehydrogenase electron transfer subunit